MRKQIYRTCTSLTEMHATFASFQQVQHMLLFSFLSPTDRNVNSNTESSPRWFVPEINIATKLTTQKELLKFTTFWTDPSFRQSTIQCSKIYIYIYSPRNKLQSSLSNAYGFRKYCGRSSVAREHKCPRRSEPVLYKAIAKNCAAGWELTVTDVGKRAANPSSASPTSRFKASRTLPVRRGSMLWLLSKPNSLFATVQALCSSRHATPHHHVMPNTNGIKQPEGEVLFQHGTGYYQSIDWHT